MPPFFVLTIIQGTFAHRDQVKEFIIADHILQLLSSEVLEWVSFKNTLMAWCCVGLMIEIVIVIWLHLNGLKWLLRVVRSQIPLIVRLSDTSLEWYYIFKSRWYVSLISRRTCHLDLSEQALTSCHHPHTIVLRLLFFIIFKFFNNHWLLRICILQLLLCIEIVRIPGSLMMMVRILDHTLFLLIDWWGLGNEVVIVHLRSSPVVDLL